MKDSIAVHSAVGRGTTFRIHIPLGSEHLPQDRVFHDALESAHAAAASPYMTEALSWLGAETPFESEIQFSHEPVLTTPADEATSPKTVLVVDDNPDMREYVARLLHDRFHVTTAENGKLAWRILAREHPDIVLTDVMMPEMDELELLAASEAVQRSRFYGRPRSTRPRLVHDPVLPRAARSNAEAICGF
ncbi:MAG: response regulator [Terracidiphilus sp.]